MLLVAVVLGVMYVFETHKVFIIKIIKYSFWFGIISLVLFAFLDK